MRKLERITPDGRKSRESRLIQSRPKMAIDFSVSIVPISWGLVEAGSNTGLYIEVPGDRRQPNRSLLHIQKMEFVTAIPAKEEAAGSIRSGKIQRHKHTEAVPVRAQHSLKRQWWWNMSRNKLEHQQGYSSKNIPRSRWIQKRLKERTMDNRKDMKRGWRTETMKGWKKEQANNSGQSKEETALAHRLKNKEVKSRQRTMDRCQAERDRSCCSERRLKNCVHISEDVVIKASQKLPLIGSDGKPLKSLEEATRWKEYFSAVLNCSNQLSRTTSVISL